MDENIDLGWVFKLLENVGDGLLSTVPTTPNVSTAALRTDDDGDQRVQCGRPKWLVTHSLAGPAPPRDTRNNAMRNTQFLVRVRCTIYIRPST